MFKFIFIMFFALTSAFCVQAMEGLITFTKKDGSTFKGYLQGDEYLNWIKTEDGKLIIYNNSSRKYEYIKIEEEYGIKSLTGTGVEYTPNTIKRSSTFNKKIVQENSINEKKLYEIKKERKEKLFLNKQ